jgi:MFS family permease
MSKTVLSIIRIFSGVIVSISNILFGVLIDKYRFKLLMIIITIIEIFVAGSIDFFVINDVIYFIYIFLVLLCIGGTFSLLAPEFNKIFGLLVGPECYGITAVWIGFTNLIGPLLIKFATNYYRIILIIGGSFCVIKLIIVMCFDDQKYTTSKPLLNKE